MTLSDDLGLPLLINYFASIFSIGLQHSLLNQFVKQRLQLRDSILWNISS